MEIYFKNKQKKQKDNTHPNNSICDILITQQPIINMNQLIKLSTQPNNNNDQPNFQQLRNNKSLQIRTHTLPDFIKKHQINTLLQTKTSVSKKSSFNIQNTLRKPLILKPISNKFRSSVRDNCKLNQIFQISPNNQFQSTARFEAFTSNNKVLDHKNDLKILKKKLDHCIEEKMTVQELKEENSINLYKTNRRQLKILNNASNIAYRDIENKRQLIQESLDQLLDTMFK